MCLIKLPQAAVAVLAACVVLLADPAAAQSKGGFKHDRSAPIEVKSETLRVIEDQNIAIFEGGVVAGQDTMRLTTDKLSVTYASLQNNAETGDIQHMRADGNVFLVNGDETAKGAWAEYDVAGGMIRLGGSVVVTQGPHVISGESAEIDLTAGTARVTGGVTSIFQPKAKKN